MAISKMAKIMIVSHRSEAGQLLEAVQHEGICQILDAEKAMVTKDWPELQVATKRTRETETLVARLAKGIDFLEKHSAVKKGILAALAPRTVIDDTQYSSVTSDAQTMSLLEQTEKCSETIDNLETEYENAAGHLEMLLPWENLATPLEDLNSLEQTSCITGLVADKLLEEVKDKAAELGAVLETVGKASTLHACVIVCLKEIAIDVGKMLRAADFETVSFESMTGTVTDLITQQRENINKINSQLASEKETATKLAEDSLSLGILYDHNNNLAGREQTKALAPATEHTLVLEGWTKERDYKKLERIIKDFSASSVSKIELAENEQPPVNIDNNRVVKPFETITRLHGMPNLSDVDPTAFLAPFFAIFFGLCLTDAGYGIVLAAAFWWLIKKFQGDKKAFWMFFICAICTIVAGALTGGWFGDAFQVLIPEGTAIFRVLNGMREKLMIFDPMTNPMTFFIISISFGYIQIMFALFIGLFNNLFRKDYATAAFNYLVWIIFLNSLMVFGITKVVEMPNFVGTAARWIAISQVVLIFLFTERKSGMAGRVGGGVFALFSTVFYFGDVLSYVRLMALGMVTAGLGMAINILVQLVMEVPYVGMILGALLFVGGHLMNLALSVLSSFVHSLRLQFVEFFPKFFTGGGVEFKPLELSFKHLVIEEKSNRK